MSKIVFEVDGASGSDSRIQGLSDGHEVRLAWWLTGAAASPERWALRDSRAAYDTAQKIANAP